MHCWSYMYCDFTCRLFKHVTCISAPVILFSSAYLFQQGLVVGCWLLDICSNKKGSPDAVVKLLPCDMRSWVQVLETASCINARKGCLHKTQNGRTLLKLQAGAICIGLPLFICSNKAFYLFRKYYMLSTREIRGGTS
jgi:hypothetical protein